MVQILVAEDERGVLRAIGEALAALSDCALILMPHIDDRAWDATGADMLLAVDHPDWLSRIADRRGTHPAIPTLIVTRSGRSDARLQALRAGADDAVDQHSPIEEIWLRATRLIGYARVRGGDVRAGGLTIDQIERRVWRDGRELGLLPREYALLMHLVRNRGQVVDRRALLASVWRLGFDPGTNVVEAHMSRLRAKLDRGFALPLIETVKGAGYRFAGLPEKCPEPAPCPLREVTVATACAG